MFKKGTKNGLVSEKLLFSTSRGGGPDPKIGIFKSEGGGVIEVHFPLFPRNDLNIYIGNVLVT